MSRYAETEEKRRVRDEAKAGGCGQCGRTEPLGMIDFHHRPGTVKVEAVSQMVGRFMYSLQQVEEEIAKCDILCRWCHIEEHPELASLGGQAMAGFGRPGKRALSEEQVAVARQMHEAGESWRAIGRHLGVSYHTVQRHVRGEHLEVRV